MKKDSHQTAHVPAGQAGCSATYPAVGMAVALLLGSQAAAAQTSPGGEAATPPQGLEEIVVTATRRTERLQDVPISVTALSGGDLEKAGLREARDLTQLVPGLNFQQVNQSAQPVIRGITTTNVGASDEANVGIYIDGIYQPDSLANNFDLLKIARVEVLRGPQGTIFGRNSTGGLINYVTPDPSFHWTGSLNGRYGRFDARQLQGYLSGPLSGTVAVDLSALYYEDDGYYRDIVLNRRAGARRSVGVRGKAMFAPSDAAKIVLTLSHNKVRDAALNSSQAYRNNTRARTVPGIVLTTVPYELVLGAENPYRVNQDGVALQTSFDLGSVRLETATSYQNNHTLQIRDADSTTAPIQVAEFPARSEYLTQEIRLLSNSEGNLNWIAGVYGLRGKMHTAVLLSNTALFSNQQTSNSTKAYAAFGEATWDLTDALKLTAGTRYSHERKGIDQNIVAIGNPTTTFAYNSHASFSRWTYRLAANYRVSPELTTYASYSTGFKSGVFNISTRVPNLVRPELITAYELGFKSDPSRLLRLNGSVFYYDYKDVQVAAALSSGPILQNAASAKPKGGELEATFAATPDLRLRLGASYVDAKYDRFLNATVTTPIASGGNNAGSRDVSGNHMVRTPPYTLSAGAAYSHAFEKGSIDANANLYMAGRTYFDFSNRLFQNSYTLVNADISWTTQSGLKIGVYGKNIFDTTYAQFIGSNNNSDQIYYGRPREYGVTAGLSF